MTEGKTVFEQIKEEHKAQAVPPSSELKEIFERTTSDITQAVTLLHEKSKRTDVEIERIKSNAIEEFKRNHEEITHKIEAQLEEREKKLQEQLAEFQRSQAVADKEAEKQAFRRSFNDFLKNGKVPENKDEKTEFVRNIYASNPTSAGFAITPVQLLGVMEQPKSVSQINQFVQRLQVNARSGVLSLKKARRITEGTVPFLLEGQEATQKYEMNMTETQYQAQPVAMVFNISRQFLNDAVNPEGMIARDVESSMDEALNIRIVNGTSTPGPTGILPEMDIVDNPNKFKAYNSATANTIALSDLKNFFRNLRIGAYRANAKYYMSVDAIADLRFETGTDGHFKWTSDISEKSPLTLNGQPVITVVEMPPVATGNIPIIYGDMEKAYALVESMGSHMIRDEVTLAASGMIRFIYFRYIDGKPVDTDALVGLRVS